MNKRLSISPAPLLAMAALAVAPVAAHAGPPELGRCVKVTTGTGNKYKDAGCEKGVVPTGKYEWFPGAVKNHFKSTEGKSTLETVGGLTVTCMKDTDHGEYTSPKTDLETIVFTGCKHNATPCQTTASGPGEITTTLLASSLGFIKAPTEVGVSLESATGEPFAQFACGPVGVVITGSVIAPITPISKMTLTFKENFKATAGKQEPENFEFEPKDTLTCSLYEVFSGVLLSTEQCGFTSADKVVNEEKLEINEVL